MGITEQHLHVLGIGDLSHLMDAKHFFKEPASGFIPKVMEKQVVETSAALRTLQRESEGVGVDREGINVCFRSLLLENRDRPGCLSYASPHCQRQAGRTAFEFDIVPRQARYLSASHTSLCSNDSKWPYVQIPCKLRRLCQFLIFTITQPSFSGLG